MSNRADFLEMREQEAFENPLDYERPEEKKKDIFDWCNDSDYKAEMQAERDNDPVLFGLNQRVNAHLGAIKRNSLKHLSDEQIENLNNKPVKEKWKPLDYHDHAKPMKAYQRMGWIPEYKESRKAMDKYDLAKFKRNEKKNNKL